MVDSKRTREVVSDKMSRRVTISEELKLINAYNDKRVMATVEGNKVIIEKII
ncbi:MAG: hypothetical protein KAT83_01255 [Candidatus Aenigmarchaeota archaeon]|nr:hypothetical protein [Candidatus Aenigmarchaeota archaeon]